MLDFINSLDGQVALKHNHITDAARYAADNWGLDAPRHRSSRASRICARSLLQVYQRTITLNATIPQWSQPVMASQLITGQRPASFSSDACYSHIPGCAG
jgi:hypothetical protein